MHQKRLILPDTNFLIECAKHKIDLRAELARICHFPYTVAIIDKTLPELAKLKTDPKTKTAAILALALIKTIPILPSENTGKNLDTILASYAERNNAIIATHDRELKKRLKTPVIVVRQGKYLALFNHNL